MTVSTPAGAPCWIELFTSDPDGAVDFYRDLLGWEATAPSEEFHGYRLFLRDGAPVGGCMDSAGIDAGPTAWSVYLRTDDVLATAERARAHGATVLAGPMQVGGAGHMLVVRDPAGAEIGAWQPSDHPGFTDVGAVGAPAWFETYSTDFKASLGFYQDVFDWRTETLSDSDEFRYAHALHDSEPLAGIMDGGLLTPDATSHWMFYARVDDVDAALDRVGALGGRVLQGPDDTPYGRLAAVADPAGAAFKLVAAPLG
ncbi:VOC family protein [Nocardioides pacificus]